MILVHLRIELFHLLLMSVSSIAPCIDKFVPNKN